MMRSSGRAGLDARLRADVSRETAPMLEGPAPEDLDAPGTTCFTWNRWRYATAKRPRVQRPEPPDHGFRRPRRCATPVRHLVDGERMFLGDVTFQFMETPGHTPESISVLVLEHAGYPVPYGVRDPPQSGHSRPTGDFRVGIVSTTLEDLAPRPPSTMGAHRSGPCRPIGTPRGTTATARVRPWVSASSPPRAAAGRKSRRRAAGDRGAQQFNVTDDCCWSSALDPQAYRVARGAVGPSLGIDRLARTHRMLHVGRPAMRDGWRPPVPTPRITQRVSRETVAGLHGGQLDRPEVDAAVADLGQRVVGATSSGGPGRWSSTCSPACCTTAATRRRPGRLNLPDVPDVSRGTRNARWPTPARRTPPTRMGRPRSCSAAAARRVGRADRPGRH